MSTLRFRFVNGVVSPSSDTPPVSTLLESHPGAYTTTRTHNNGSHLLFWERHVGRLSNSARILFNSNPNLWFKFEKARVPFSLQSMQSSVWESVIRSLVTDSIGKALPFALEERKSGEELAVTTLVSGTLEKLSGNESVDEERISRVFDVYVHVGVYVPLVCGNRENGAHLAVVGRRRDVANVKYSEWVSNEDKEKHLHGYRSASSIEIQTAPISDGVLPGVIRQVIIKVCSRNRIPLQEVAPSWSNHELWEEAFITNSLRLLQHVETVRVPSSWELLESKTWKEVIWEEKRFEEGAGSITALIQKEIMEKAVMEGFPVTSFNG